MNSHGWQTTGKDLNSDHPTLFALIIIPTTWASTRKGSFGAQAGISTWYPFLCFASCVSSGKQLALSGLSSSLSVQYTILLISACGVGFSQIQDTGKAVMSLWIEPVQHGPPSTQSFIPPTYVWPQPCSLKSCATLNESFESSESYMHKATPKLTCLEVL